MKQFLWSIWEIFEVVLISVVTVIFIRSFLVQPFLVSGASMEPVFHDGDYLMVDEISYRFRQPDRGEVVVFHPPSGQSFFIKRIIALPGERLEIKNGQVKVYRGDKVSPLVLSEDYLSPGVKTFGDINVVLEEGEYYVLGDNRNFSYDSRSWGPLSRDKIVGLVRVRLWPLNKVMAFEAPAY